MNLHAWVIMSNHIHLVISASGGIMINDLMRDLKKFTSHKIIKAIAENQQKSRREWMLNLFRYAGMNSNNESLALRCCKVKFFESIVCIEL